MLDTISTLEFKERFEWDQSVMKYEAETGLFFNSENDAKFI